MFGKRIRLFELLGFEVRIDLSWIVIAALLAWTLSEGYFPNLYADQDLSRTTYWILGLSGALGLFFSIVFHEFFHSIVARRYGIPMRGITLFIFGGIAEMDQEPRDAKSEFLMAIAGPLASLGLGLVLLASMAGMQTARLLPEVAYGVLQYVGVINVALALFNMIPAFPLDGGRVLRSILWKMQGDHRRATRIAAMFGRGFGTLLILLGIASLFFGAFIAAVWNVLLGLFIRVASGQSYERVLIQDVLGGRPVREFLQASPERVAPDQTLSDAVENHIYPARARLLPVTVDGRLHGCLTAQAVRATPAEERDRVRVGDVMEPCDSPRTIEPDADAMDALTRMQQSAREQLLVVGGEGRLEGVVRLQDLLGYLSLKMDLEGDAPNNAKSRSQNRLLRYRK